MIKNCLILSLVCFIFPAAFAQKVEFGGGGGVTYYKGDLQPTFRPLTPAAGGDLFFRYNIDRVMSAKLNLFYGQIKGDDKNSGDPFLQNRNFSFVHQLLDYSIQLEYNFLNFRTHTGRYEHDWTPYLFGGFGRSHTLSTIYKRADVHANSPLNNNINILPFGIGFKKILGPRLNVSAEFSTRIFLNQAKGSSFDGLDGFTNKNIYADLGLLQNETPVNQDKFYQLPNTKVKDKYFHVSVTLSYLIYRVNCNIPGKSFSFF